jgi:hypothetical protein
MLRPERALFAGLILFALLRTTTCTNAHAQDISHAQPPPVDETVLRDFVRIAAHESGLDSPGDLPGIWAVWVNGGRREHMSPLAFGHAYSRRFFGGTDRTINRWTSGLELDCARPPGFTLRWDRARPNEQISRRDACLLLVAAAREVIAAPPVCDATDWGNAADHERARRLGRHFVMVTCGDAPARNLFSRRVRTGR